MQQSRELSCEVVCGMTFWVRRERTTPRCAGFGTQLREETIISGTEGRVASGTIVLVIGSPASDCDLGSATTRSTRSSKQDAP